VGHPTSAVSPSLSAFPTKAAHLEVVQDLTTDSFIAAQSIYISLRGSLRTIRSDNATNFVGAKSELAELKELFLSEQHRYLPSV